MVRKQSAEAAVDRQLARYRAMRDFGVTAEPRGEVSPRARQALPFVVQKHQATRLHYDFRLGWNGVLKSWAVAKGPSYNPADKRLAVQVEDHPIEYGGFEGAIPKGQYGGGTVMIWDQGTWEPHGDADEALRDGHLKFTLHGEKLQGEWVLVRMRGRLTRNGLNWTRRMPEIARAAAELPVKAALLDGEVVVLEPSGQTSFAALQAAFQEGRRERLLYFAFDLLHLDGHNLRNLPLTRRKDILAGLLKGTVENSVIRLSEPFHVSGRQMFSKACQLHAEGIVSKLAASTYNSGRSGSWLKIKCGREQEFVIGGFTPRSKGGHGIGALLLGYYEEDKLIYAGRSGTGFTQKMQFTLRSRLDKLLEKQSSFARLPVGARRNARWVKPKLVAQIAFATWTTDNLVRQAAFKGLREDKAADEVVREESASLEQSSHAPTRKIAAKVVRKSQLAPKPAGDSAGLEGFHLTHPNKQLDEASGLNKRDLANYYLGVADYLLPQIAGRPLSVVRCPEGSTRPCFFQKHVGIGLPDGVDTVPVRDRKTAAIERYIAVSSAEGLVGLAQMGGLEIHPWGSRNDSLEKPDRIIFDLDPDPSISWKLLSESALTVRALLKKFGLQSFVKFTGGKGFHVVVPIRAEHSWPTVKAFAHNLSSRIEQSQPELFITKMTKSARSNKIYLDYLRNDRGSTAVAAYSPRARAGIPVAVPLSWTELDASKAPEFTVAGFARWKARLRRNPWKEMNELDQSLTQAALEAAGTRS